MTEETEKETKAKAMANDIIAELDKLLDDVKSNLSFRLLDYFDNYIINVYKHKNTRMRQDVCREIHAYYEKMSQELEKALVLTKANIQDDEDTQLYEAYSSYKKNDIRNMYNFVNQILIDCEQIRNRFKENRSSNKRRQSAFKTNKERVLKNLVYCKECPEYNLKSFPAENIFLYTMIIAFDHSKKNLILIESSDGKPFEIRGKTFTNAITRSKTLKDNTLQHIEKITKANKDNVKDVFFSINRKEKSAAKRLNENVLLLKGFKK